MAGGGRTERLMALVAGIDPSISVEDVIESALYQPGDGQLREEMQGVYHRYVRSLQENIRIAWVDQV